MIIGLYFIRAVIEKKSPMGFSSIHKRLKQLAVGTERSVEPLLKKFIEDMIAKYRKKPGIILGKDRSFNIEWFSGF